MPPLHVTLLKASFELNLEFFLYSVRPVFGFKTATGKVPVEIVKLLKYAAVLLRNISLVFLFFFWILFCCAPSRLKLENEQRRSPQSRAQCTCGWLPAGRFWGEPRRPCGFGCVRMEMLYPSSASSQGGGSGAVSMVLVCCHIGEGSNSASQHFKYLAATHLVKAA